MGPLGRPSIRSEKLTVPSAVEVTAPSRLHFGLFSFGNPAVRQFGGVGVMIDQPGLRLRITSAENCAVDGPLANRARSVLDRLAREGHAPPCRIEIITAPAEHQGLGTGTQLALAISAGIQRFAGGPLLDAPSLAARAQRGLRSAVGTYGFLLGGMLVDDGKLPGQAFADLRGRVALPKAWRFVLVCPRHEQGLSGANERQAFADLPAVPEATTRLLRRLAIEELVPAGQAADFARFSEAVFEYGYQAGLCFAPRQGGPFASRWIADCVARLRDWGIRGVGQSSWGPTVFALMPDEYAATDLVERLHREVEAATFLTIAKPANAGAAIKTQAAPR